MLVFIQHIQGDLLGDQIGEWFRRRHPEHCRHIICDKGLEQYQAKLANQRGLRVLALHSWDKGSHARLKAILQSWLQRGLVDVAIGSGFG
ncbi:MAG: hypothetical protein ACKOPS_26970 [Cyanobium sp.]